MAPPPPPPASQNYDKSRFRYVSPELKRKLAVSIAGAKGQQAEQREPDNTMS